MASAQKSKEGNNAMPNRKSIEKALRVSLKFWRPQNTIHLNVIKIITKAVAPTALRRVRGGGATLQNDASPQEHWHCHSAEKLGERNVKPKINEKT